VAYGDEERRAVLLFGRAQGLGAIDRLGIEGQRQSRAIGGLADILAQRAPRTQACRGDSNLDGSGWYRREAEFFEASPIGALDSSAWA
jgi:hypothetical protein